ncbi:MAG: hypothetical protein VX498_09760, partial [Myxococcota bacterium]|nr:hypothetical protein [Myxococcota bacterium]
PSPVDEEPAELQFEASEPTLPHRRDDLPDPGEPATQRMPELDVDSGELAPMGDDDGPVFGDIPTVHSKQQIPDSD